MPNPYWDAVQPAVKAGDFSWEGPQVARFKFDFERQPGEPEPLDRHDYVGVYSWTITDPASVVFVAMHAHNGLVDPMAGTGYWAYVLSQLDVDVVSYDLDGPDDNTWHKGKEPWVDIELLDATLSVVKHPDRTLLLSWPPYSMDIAVRTLNAYRGNRLIYIGEPEGGCTASDLFFEVLDQEWKEVVEHRPVQWWGLHDRITVYERKTRDQMPDLVSELRDRETLRPRTKRLDAVPGSDGLPGDLVPPLQRSE